MMLKDGFSRPLLCRYIPPDTQGRIQLSKDPGPLPPLPSVPALALLTCGALSAVHTERLPAFASVPSPSRYVGEAGLLQVWQG